MTTILHIGGGEARSSPEEYTGFLKNFTLDIRHNKRRKRNRKYDEIFPQTKSLKPEMPSPHNAKYINRKIRFEKYLEQLFGEIIFIGHSLGANFLGKRFSENSIEQWGCSVKQLHLVAGCFGINGQFGMESFPGFIESQVSNIHIYHSTDDNLVLFEESQKYKNRLPLATFHQFDDKGHFLQEDFLELYAEIQKGL